MSLSPHFHFILSPYQNAFFHELADVLVHELSANGVAAEITTPAAVELRDDTVFVLLPPHEYVALEGDPWLHDPALMARTIGLLAEQPSQAHFAQNADIARHMAAVFDFNASAAKAYERHGIHARHLHLGYSQRWDRFTDDWNPSLDLLYMGSDEPRRQEILATCAPAISEHRSRLIVSDNLSPNRGTSATFIAGDAKRALLADSRLLLNIHRSDEPYFEWLRFIEAFHCGTPVLSEPSMATHPFVAGTHFLSAAPAALPAAIRAALRSPELLDEIRHHAYEELRRRPLSRALDELVEVARGLTTRTVPTSVPPFHRRAPHPHPYDELLDLDAHSDLSIVRQQMRELRLDLQGLRRQITALELAVTTPAGAQPPPVSVTATSAAARLATEPPTVSVVMALFNHDEFVAEALESAAAAAVGYSYELVVVDDGSTDGSGATVRDWIRHHPWVRATLLTHRTNRGLPTARNTAVEHASGEFLFVLDADNSILPGAFATLIEPLRADPEAAFAYGMLEAFTHEGPTAVMGIWPWQPKRLRNGNYIDAMALIRAAVVREFGGYTTDRRLYGWEDYDLWCRLAEAGRYGRQVTTFVARYRRSLTSMVALSNVSQVPAFAALAERCPALMGGALDHVEVPAYQPSRSLLASTSTSSEATT